MANGIRMDSEAGTPAAVIARQLGLDVFEVIRVIRDDRVHLPPLNERALTLVRSAVDRLGEERVAERLCLARSTVECLDWSARVAARNRAEPPPRPDWCPDVPAGWVPIEQPDYGTVFAADQLKVAGVDLSGVVASMERAEAERELDVWAQEWRPVWRKR